MNLSDQQARSYSSRGPLRIPNARLEINVPPPLPPPPRILDLENGYDVGWLHANGRGVPDIAKLPPINPSSSLFGGHHTPRQFPSLDRLNDDDRRKSCGSVDKSLRLHADSEPPGRSDDGFRGSISSTRSEPILQGEQNFSRKCVQSSSNDYDRQLLSKIGKPSSPPRTGSTSSSLPLHTRRTSRGSGFDESLKIPDTFSGATSFGPSSPGVLSPWREYSEYRSPSVDSNAPSTTDWRTKDGVTPQSDDAIFFSDMGADTGRQHGMKRRALSPPRELAADENTVLHHTKSHGDLSQRRTSGLSYLGGTSPASWYSPSGSFSPLSAGSHRTTASYGSSTSLSIGGSSMTSLGSYDRLSMGGSPLSEGDIPDNKPLNPNLGGSLFGGVPTSGPYSGLSGPSDLKASYSPQRTSLRTSLPGTQLDENKVGVVYVCECCPKKPKKFETKEQLRAHESEKQYSCQFCNNRFKNKNEAERHQNSLHLRRHSWSCAALCSFEAAFHPSLSSVEPDGTPSFDVCGYCGEEFPNFPQPDWQRRHEHVTSVHKFGECNNVKKFFRADHFRQHLKHSHAGKPGKWTNVLENACMREEPQAERLAGSGAGSTGLMSNTIDEVMDES